MPSSTQFLVPDEAELVAFFGVEAKEKRPQDGYWSFEIRTVHGLTFVFSFDVAERSVQTMLSQPGQLEWTVSHELAEQIAISGAELRATFSSPGSKTVLSLRLSPSLRTTWSTLRTG